MDKDTEQRFEAIEKRLDALENKKIITVESNSNKEPNSNNGFIFVDKKKDHNILLEELLKSEFCHSKNGLVVEEILDVFSKNGRPVVPKKITDLLHAWKKRNKIEAIKVNGSKQLKYFWIENETNSK